MRYPPSYYLLSDDSSTIQDTKFIQLSKNSEQELPIIAISIEPAGGYLDTYLTNKAYYEDAKKKDELYRSMDNQETDIFPGKSEQQYEEITVDGYATYLVSTRFLDPFSTVTSAAFLRNNLTYKFTLITEDVADLKNFNEIINTFKFTDSYTISGGMFIISKDTSENMLIYSELRSNQGDINQMKIWSDTIDNQTWENYSPLAVYPPSTTIYTQYKDTSGNVSEIFEDKYKNTLLTNDSVVEYYCGGIMEIECPANYVCNSNSVNESPNANVTIGKCEKGSSLP